MTAVAVSLICLQTVSFSATETASELASEIAVKESENATLTADITQLNTDIENTRLEIAKTQQEVDESNAIIKGLSTEIDDNKSALKKRLLSMYLAGSASNLEIILGADDLDDFMDKLEYISIITENDSKLIGNLNQQVSTNKKANKVLSDNLKKLKEDKKTLESKRTEFQDLLIKNQAELNYLYGESVIISDALHSGDEDGYVNGDIISYYDKQQNALNSQLQAGTGQSAQGKPQSKPSSGNSSNLITNSPNSNVVIKPKPVPIPTQPPATEPPLEDNNTGNIGNVGDGTDNNNTIKGYVWPVPGFYHLTSLWDEDRGSYNHGALDIASAGVEGANVVAARSGIVDVAQNDCVHNWGKDSSCGCGGGYGNWVRIDHGDGYSTIYAHMSSITVGYGDYVEAGQLLGFVGSTGYSTGAHLHYETLYDGVKYNPLDEYPGISITY